ncbi:MAG: hypothetical protein ABIF82_00150 [Planctomycetota bacterium]
MEDMKMKPRINGQVLVVALIGVAVVLAAGGARAQFLEGIDTNSAELPPTEGEYRTPQQVHAEYDGPGLNIVLRGIRHRAFAGAIRDAVGDDELETFDSVLHATATVDIGLGPVATAVTLTGPVQTVVTNRRLSTTGTFATEIVSMSLSGNVGGMLIEIREHEEEASTGQTDITDLGGGLYHIDSFFDVFTELSVDGGATWMPDLAGPVHVALGPIIPEPAGLGLVGLALLAVRRKRS